MAYIQRDEDVRDNSRLELCNGSVILSGNSPQGSVTRSSIESVRSTNATTILAGIFDDYHDSSTSDISQESKVNSLMNRNITIEEKEIRNLAATSPVTLQRKTRAVTPIKEKAQQRISESISLSHDENAHVSTNFVSLPNVTSNSGIESLIELCEYEAVDWQNGSQIDVETNLEQTIIMKDIGARIEFGNNSPTATGNTDSKFLHMSTVVKEFLNKISHCTDQRKSENQTSDRKNNEDSAIEHSRSPRYVTTHVINFRRSVTRRRCSRSPMRKSLISCTPEKVHTVADLVDKWSKLSAVNKVQNSPRFRRPPKNARRSLLNISTRATVLTARKKFLVHRSPNKSLHSSKGLAATSTLEGGKQVNQQTMKPVGCSYIRRIPSKSMQASNINHRTSAVSPVRASRDKRLVDKDDNFTVARLIDKFSNFSSEEKIKNCMSSRQTAHDVKKSLSDSSMRGTPLRRTPNSMVNRSTRESPVPTKDSSSASSLRREEAPINRQTMKNLKYSHIVRTPSKSMRPPSVNKTKVAPALRGSCGIRKNKGLSIPKIVIHSASGLSSLQLDSAPLIEKAVVSLNRSNNSPQRKGDNVNKMSSLTPEYSGLRAENVRKNKLDSVSSSETSLFKIRKTGVDKHNHKRITSPVRSYIRGAGQRKTLFNISRRGTVLKKRKSFRVNRAPNKSLHSSKSSSTTLTLLEGKQINQKTMKPIGCSYIGRTPSKSMRASKSSCHLKN